MPLNSLVIVTMVVSSVRVALASTNIDSVGIHRPGHDHTRADSDTNASTNAIAKQTSPPNLRYFSVWELENAENSSIADVKEWANLLFTSSNPRQIVEWREQHGIQSSLFHAKDTLFWINRDNHTAGIFI